MSSTNTSAPVQAKPVKAKGLSDFVQFDDETILWTASLILLNHLQQPKQRQEFAGKRVLELGSGLGHLGLGLRNLGAHVTCTERPKELPALQANLEKHQHDRTSILESALALYGHNRADGQQTSKEVSEQDGTNIQGSIQAVSLEWGKEGYDRSPLATQSLGSFDIIICSELYYIERLFPELLWTLRRFAGPQTVVWSIFIDRPFSFNFFALLHDEGCWEVDSIEDFDNLGLDSELQVHMHCIRLKATEG